MADALQASTHVRLIRLYHAHLGTWIMCTDKLLNAHLRLVTPSAMNKKVLRRAQGKAKKRVFQAWRQARDNDLVISTSAAEDAGLDVRVC
jgi:hypothetical protein